MDKNKNTNITQTEETQAELDQNFHDITLTEIASAFGIDC